MHLRRIGLGRAWVAWGLAASFYLVALFHRMSLGVASLDAQERFGLSAGTIATLSALQLGLYLAWTIPAGLAADRIGPRRALTIGLVLMAVGETAFGLAAAAPLALGGRALVGVGDAFMFLSVLRIAQNWFPARRYALLASLTGLAGAIGQIGTTVPLGAALEGIGWTATFAGSGALTAALAVLCMRFVRDRPAGAPAPGGAPDARRMPVGATLRAAWTQPATRRAFWSHFALMGPFVAITALWGYPWLVRAQDVAPATARAWLMLCVVAFGASAPAFGALAARGPAVRDALLRWGAVALAAGWSAALLWPGGHAPAAVVVTALVLTGLAGACAMLSFDVARAGNPSEHAGAATGLANTGGFSAAVATQLAAAAVLHVADVPIGVALLPMLGLLLAAAVRVVRGGGRRAPEEAPAALAA
ncbi:MAG TPA: MFS transporter [Miltoncostaeaceae bacterium]|nr:MFS transporter [Miltoncostaeaceae bacterium]